MALRASEDLTETQQVQLEQMKKIIDSIWTSYYKLYVYRRSGVSLEMFERAVAEATVPKYLHMWNSESFNKFIEEDFFYGIPRQD